MELDTYIALCNRVKAYVALQNEHGELPTFRALARRYRVSIALIEQIVEDADLNYNIGIRTGMGIYVHPRKGDYTVEYLGER